MRLQERGLIQARLAGRIAAQDGLGGRPEAFSQETVSFRASLLPEGGEMEVSGRGLKSGERIRLLAPSDLDVKSGDGVHAGDGFYIVLAVKRWAAHLEMICEARA